MPESGAQLLPTRETASHRERGPYSPAPGPLVKQPEHSGAAPEFPRAPGTFANPLARPRARSVPGDSREWLWLGTSTPHPWLSDSGRTPWPSRLWCGGQASRQACAYAGRTTPKQGEHWSSGNSPICPSTRLPLGGWSHLRFTQHPYLVGPMQLLRLPESLVLPQERAAQEQLPSGCPLRSRGGSTGELGYRGSHEPRKGLPGPPAR